MFIITFVGPKTLTAHLLQPTTTMDGQSKQLKKGRGRPPKHPGLTPKQRHEQRKAEKREYSRRPDVQKRRREREDSTNNLVDQVTGSLNLVTNNVTDGLATLVKGVVRSRLRTGAGKRRKASKRRIEGDPLTIPEEESEDEAPPTDPLPDNASELSMSDVSTRTLLAGKAHHNRVSDSESLQLQHDDGEGFDEDDEYMMSDRTAFSSSTMISNTTGMSNTTAMSNHTTISLRHLYSDEEIAKIHATVENGFTVWTIHVMERMFQRSIFESAISNALQAGAYKPDGSSCSNIKVIHKDLVVIIDVKPDRGTCHLITTFRIGSRKNLKVGKNFGRKPVNNPDDIKRFELCRSIFLEQLEKVQHSEKQQQQEIIELRRQLQMANEKLQFAKEDIEYYKWRCNRQEKDEIVFDEEDRAYRRNKRFIDDYDGEFMSPTKRSKRSMEAPSSAPHHY